MLKISDIDLASSILSICILIGFIGSALAVVKITIIGINYIKENLVKEEKKSDPTINNSERKRF